MPDDAILKDQKKRINKVVNFLLKNANEEHSLKKLASLAHYSPFHFQRVFTQIMGLSPKQYAIRNRLENACHAVFIHRHKSIASIAMEHGFSSPAVFARAFKAQFGVSPEGFRKSDVARKTVHERIEKEHHHQSETPLDYSWYNKAYWRKQLAVDVLRLPARKLISVSAPLDDALQIREAFMRVTTLAGVYDLLSEQPQYAGIVNPHQGKYWASVVVDDKKNFPDELNPFMVEAGRYATYKLKGDTVKTFHSLHAFFDLWLSQSGYRIKDLFGMEQLFQNPLLKPYEKIERQIYISIEPL